MLKLLSKGFAKSLLMMYIELLPEEITNFMEWAETILHCTRYTTKLRFSGGKCLVAEVERII